MWTSSHFRYNCASVLARRKCKAKARKLLCIDRLRAALFINCGKIHSVLHSFPFWLFFSHSCSHFFRLSTRMLWRWSLIFWKEFFLRSPFHSKFIHHRGHLWAENWWRNIEKSSQAIWHSSYSLQVSSHEKESNTHKMQSKIDRHWHWQKKEKRVFRFFLLFSNVSCSRAKKMKKNLSGNFPWVRFSFRSQFRGQSSSAHTACFSHSRCIYICGNWWDERIARCADMLISRSHVYFLLVHGLSSFTHKVVAVLAVSIFVESQNLSARSSKREACTSQREEDFGEEDMRKFVI